MKASVSLDVQRVSIKRTEFSPVTTDRFIECSLDKIQTDRQLSNLTCFKELNWILKNLNEKIWQVEEVLSSCFCVELFLSSTIYVFFAGCKRTKR